MRKHFGTGGSVEITLPTAAHRLGVAWTVAYRWALEGRIEARQEGRRWKINSESVERLSRELAEESEPAPGYLSAKRAPRPSARLGKWP